MTVLRKEIALIKKPYFPFLNVAKIGPARRNDNSSGYKSATVNKKRKGDEFEFETVLRIIRSTKEVKMGTNNNPTVIKVVKNPQSVVIFYVDRLSENITISQMEEYCVESNLKLLQFRQILKSEAQLKFFHCAIKFDEEKFELTDFWPENFSVLTFYLNETARG